MRRDCRVGSSGAIALPIRAETPSTIKRWPQFPGIRLKTTKRTFWQAGTVWVSVGAVRNHSGYHFNAFLGIHSAQREHFLLGSNNNDAKNALPKTTTKTSEEINKKIKTQALTSLLIIHHTAKNRGQDAGGRFSRAP